MPTTNTIMNAIAKRTPISALHFDVQSNTGSFTIIAHNGDELYAINLTSEQVLAARKVPGIGYNIHWSPDGSHSSIGVTRCAFTAVVRTRQRAN